MDTGNGYYILWIYCTALTNHLWVHFSKSTFLFTRWHIKKGKASACGSSVLDRNGWNAWNYLSSIQRIYLSIKYDDNIKYVKVISVCFCDKQCTTVLLLCPFSLKSCNRTIFETTGITHCIFYVIHSKVYSKLQCIVLICTQLHCTKLNITEVKCIIWNSK